MLRAVEIRTQSDAVLDAGPAPILQWIAIERLVVDETYQRELLRGNWSAIRRIAKQFAWSRFSPVFVAPVEGGRFAIIDGQHRTHAAASLGILEVPCQIVQMDRAEQAASFAAVNGLVTKVTLLHLFRAALAAGEGWAVEADAAVKAAGCRLMTSNLPTDEKKPGDVFAVRLVRELVANGKGDAVTLALSGLRRSVFGTDAAAYTNEVLRPLLTAISDRPWIVASKPDLAPFIDAFDIWTVLDRADAFVRDKRRSGVVGVSRFDIAAADLGEALDKTFPQRISAAPSRQVSAALDAR